MAKKIAEEVRLLDHLRAIVAAVRRAAVRVVFVPHRRWQPGDILIKEHWPSSGFASTCVECTVRFGSELGYHVTLARDATAAFSREAMHAAHDINGPGFAHAIVTTDKSVRAFDQTRGTSMSPSDRTTLPLAASAT